MGKSEPSADKPDDNPKFRRHATEKSRSAIGDRIVEALAGRSQAWLARQAGIEASTLSDILAKSMPSADRAVALADALDVPVRWLITGEVEERRPLEIDVNWIGMPRFALSDLGSGKARSPIDIVSIHRNWLTREALGAPKLWVTAMPSSHLTDVPSEGDMIVCCDALAPHGEGVFLYRYNGVPIARRFVGYPSSIPGVMDVTTYEFDGMNLIGRVLGAIKLQAL